MTTDLEAIGYDLHRLLGRRIDVRLRRKRRLRTSGLAAGFLGVFAAVAVASGVGGDLQLGPTKWSVLGTGSVDDGQGAYVHARKLDDGSNSTFLVEHDADLPPYRAFVLHETTLAAAERTSPVPVRSEPGALCTPAQLTRAEVVALSVLRTTFSPAAPPAASKAAVDGAVQTAFATSPCKGLEFGAEQARLSYASVLRDTKLMPGAQ
ncbi:MAG: hypothetical protein ABI927_07190 [Gaiellaceae bacterium]